MTLQYLRCAAFALAVGVAWRHCLFAVPPVPFAPTLALALALAAPRLAFHSSPPVPGPSRASVVALTNSSLADCK